MSKKSSRKRGAIIDDKDAEERAIIVSHIPLPDGK